MIQESFVHGDATAEFRDAIEFGALVDIDDVCFLLVRVHQVEYKDSRRFYCVLTLGDQHARTTATNEKRWDESFSFLCLRCDCRLLKIEVYSSSSTYDDLLVGQVVHDIHTTPKLEYWQNVDRILHLNDPFYDLYPSSFSSDVGKITITTRYIVIVRGYPFICPLLLCVVFFSLLLLVFHT
jgi:hypothetical protein